MILELFLVCRQSLGKEAMLVVREWQELFLSTTEACVTKVTVKLQTLSWDLIS